MTQDIEQFLIKNGIFTLPLEIPFPVAPVNCTIIDGNPPAIVDPGMDWKDTMEIISEKFENYTGKKIDKLGEIYLTHPHIDHFGTAEKLRKLTDAKIYTLNLGKHRFENYMKYWKTDREYYIKWLQISQAPPDKLREAREYRSNFHSYASHPKIDITLSDRSEFTIAGRIKAILLHLPGHTPWCSSLWLPQLNLLIAGDLFVYRTTSASLIYPPESAPTRWQGISAYRKSLKKLRELSPKTIITGHGPTATDGQHLIEKSLKKQEKKFDQLKEILALNGPLTAYRAAQLLYGREVTEKNLYLTINDTTRYLEHLQREKRAVGYLRNGLFLWDSYR